MPQRHCLLIEGRRFEQHGYFVQWRGCFTVDVSSWFDVMMALFCVYYVFNIHYPAAYGLLNILDKYVLKEGASENKTSSVTLKKFFLNYKKFVSASNVNL